MDLSTLVGLVGGAVLLLWAMTQNGLLLDFIDPASMAITLGGTLAATMINFPLQKLKATFQVIRHVVWSREPDLQTLIQTVAGYAERARREGLLALEGDADSAPDPFLRKALGLVVDGTDPDTVHEILELDLTALEERHKLGSGLFEAMAQYAPAFGLVGTLVGLIQMLKGMEDTAAIGPGMAVALLTTLYGALLANLVFLPIAGKLKVRSREEVLRKEVIMEGILAIQTGDSPSVITEKLNSFLAPGYRAARGGRRGSDPLDEEEL